MRIKIFILIAIFFSAAEANNSVISFYKSALKTLSYENTYTLQIQSEKLTIEAKKMRRFINLNGGVLYGYTKAKLLHDHFNNTDIGLSDTIDIFGKSADYIQLIQLQMKANRFLLQIKKEQLFLALTEMIVAYRMSEEKWEVSRKVYQEQNHLLEKMRIAEKAGKLPAIELSRFENNLALLNVKMNQEKQIIDTMKGQLLLYGKGHAIPHIRMHTLQSDLKNFLSHSPQMKLNDNQATQSLESINKLKHSWIPDAVIGANQVYNDDPTDSGNHYTLSVGLTMSFDGGMSNDIESQKVNALRIQSQSKELEVQRTIQYLTWKNMYTASKKSFYALKKTLANTSATLKNIKTAYLKHYIDFNSYLQTIQEDLATKNAEISEKYNMIKSTIILNTLSQGTIYE
jgi:outer membrane protein TolC